MYKNLYSKNGMVSTSIQRMEINFSLPHGGGKRRGEPRLFFARHLTLDAFKPGLLSDGRGFNK